MSGPVFVDTNVLLYAEDPRDATKSYWARGLIDRIVEEQSGHISMQVLQEFFSAATGKLKMDPVLVRKRLDVYLTRLEIVLLEPNDLLAAIDIHRLYQFSIWDALILRAALISGCRKLYSEDLQHGFRLERLEVVNPFYEPPPLMVHDG